MKTTNPLRETRTSTPSRPGVSTRLGAYFTLIRVPNCLMIGLAVVIGETIALGTRPSFGKGAFGFLTAFLLLAGTMILNDIHDIPVDRLNSPSRPLPSGKIGLTEAYVLSVLFSGLGIVFSAFLGIATLLIALLALILMVYYNTRGKETGLLGNAVVSFNVALPFVFGGVAVSNFRPLLFLFSVLAFLANMAREVTKGIADVAGDSARGVKTLAVSKGLRPAALAASVLFAAAVALSFFTPLLDSVSIFYYPGIFLADIGFLYSAYRLLRDQRPETVKVVKTQVLVWMLFGMLGFLMGGSSVF